MEKSGQKISVRISPTEERAVEMIIAPKVPIETKVVLGGLLRVAEWNDSEIEGSTFEDWPVTTERSFEASSGPEA